ncbi:MAG: hypothetical protein EOM06_09215 [Sphingobacteriia bacterium]|nr:hypothetical protein [Sphingobacteriia bacterium]
MKKNYLYSLAIMLLAAFIAVPLLNSCKSSKKSAAMPAGEEKIEVYCSGPEYFSNGEYFRANDVGESTNQSMAKRKAMSNARLGMAAAIETTVKAVIDNYFNSYTSNKTIEDKERYEGLSREVINQKLNGIRTICEEYTKTAEGNYKCYVAIELAGDEIATGMANRISEDDKLKIDFQYENFKKTFEKEMEEFKNERY